MTAMDLEFKAKVKFYGYNSVRSQ